jgi:CMP-N,N'-diacetyllegionaminic acid synthase
VFTPIIIARKGSKGVPGKNSRMLNNKPLISYTVEWAEAEGLQKADIILFTDCEELLAQGESLGLNCKYRRPKECSGDHCSSWETLCTLLKMKELSEVSQSHALLLQLTTPFRQKGLLMKVGNAIKAGYNSGFTVFKVPYEYSAAWQFSQAVNTVISPLEPKIKLSQYMNGIAGRQSLTNTYVRNGSLYFFHIEKSIEMDSMYVDNVTMIEEMQVGSYVNIDNLEDWRKAEEIAMSIIR